MKLYLVRNEEPLDGVWNIKGVVAAEDEQGAVSALSQRLRDQGRDVNINEARAFQCGIPVGDYADEPYVLCYSLHNAVGGESFDILDEEDGG